MHWVTTAGSCAHESGETDSSKRNIHSSTKEILYIKELQCAHEVSAFILVLLGIVLFSKLGKAVSQFLFFPFI